ncbi:hypothetical protein DSO57_1023651 [Entomophthora muscae]|uniref:Uncharacterized protein n=1 Tax=Entomophthora muscae TaxID=34485 RepID=A0ACC2S4V2_9FUNG|nr:hypothetical protein DSO57_1023651 [Entomophthora muscae]
MPCKPVTNQDHISTTPAKPAQKRIPNIKHIILLKLMRESGNYKVATAIVGVDPKYASKTFNKFINTSQVLAAEKSIYVSTIFLETKFYLRNWLGEWETSQGLAQLICVSTMLTKEHKWAICQWITQDCHLELVNIQAMVKSTFGVEALISFYYHLVKEIQFSWKKLGVSPYNWNSPANIKTQKNYAEAYTSLKAKGTVKLYYIDKSAFALSMQNEYGYITKGSNDGMAWHAAVRATAYSMVALLGPKEVELYQMVLGSHNSCTFLSFL